MIITNSKAYDRLKFMAMIGLPAIATFYLGLGQLWGWDHTEKAVATIVLINTLLGALLQISNKQYQNDPANYDGFINATGADPDTGLPNLQLTVTKHPDEILQGKTGRFKVGPPPGQHRAA